MTLQEKMNKALVNRLSLISSPIYSLKLTRKVTPRGLSIFKISASAVRSSQKIGYPTPKTGTGGPNHGMNLEGMVQLMSVAVWGTPNCMDYLPIRSDEALAKAKAKAGCSNLKDQVPLAGWGTPACSDENKSRCSVSAAEREFNRPNGSKSSLALQAMVLTDGVMSNGFIVETTNTDQSFKDSNRLSEQLNPALPRWLMGYPQEWCIAAVTASRLMPTKRKKRG